MAFNLKMPNLKFQFPSFGLGKIGAAIRFLIMKAIGLVLCVLFLSLAALLLSYSIISVASTLRGQDAKIISFSGQVGKYHTAFRLGGLFQISAEMNKKKYEKIYSLYPVWPDTFNPMKGDVVRVWPVKQPLAAAPAVDGWGWFIVGTLFIMGLVMLEFAFLSLMIS